MARVTFNEKVAVREQQQTASLSWETLGDFECALKSAAHAPADLASKSVVASAIAAAVGGGGGGLLSPPGAHRARAALASPPAAAAAAPPKLIHRWHCKKDGCIYQGAEHSSPIASVQGAVATTRSGSVYVLGELDPAVADILQLLAPGAFDPLDPLAPGTQKLLLLATSLAYGPAAPHAAALREALAGLEAALGGAQATAPVFAAVRQQLLRLGVRA